VNDLIGDRYILGSDVLVVNNHVLSVAESAGGALSTIYLPGESDSSTLSIVTISTSTIEVTQLYTYLVTDATFSSNPMKLAFFYTKILF
jgi:hypothetical protein